MEPILSGRISLARSSHSGVDILLVEKNAVLALCISARCYVTEKGRVVDEAASVVFLVDDRRLREYLVI